MLCDRFMIFVSSIMKGHILSIVRIDTRGCNDGSSKISADIFDGMIRRSKAWFCENIESLRVFVINLIFDFFEGRTKFESQLVE